MSEPAASAPAGVLVVEDDRDLREVLAESLQLEGYQVEGAADGADALERLRNGARPGLIILDLVMPRMDGRQLVNALSEDPCLAAIPVVLTTGTPPRDMSGKVLAILKKPIGIADLLPFVQRYCDATLLGVDAPWAARRW